MYIYWSSTYIDSSEDINDKDPKFKIGGIVRISKYKNIFPNWSEEIFVIEKVKNNLLWTYVFIDFKGKEIVETFHEKQLQKSNQKEFIVEKVIKTKGDKLHVKCKGYNSSFNSWIDEKGSINEGIFSRTDISRRKSKRWIKIPDITNLAINTTLNAKINEVKKNTKYY